MHDSLVSKSAPELMGKVIIRRLADSVDDLVADRVVEGLVAILVGLPFLAIRRRLQHDGETSSPAHSYCALGLALRRALEHWKQELGEQERAEDVRLISEVQTLGAALSLGRDHHAGVVVEPVQLVLLGKKFIGALLDTTQVAKVEVQVVQASLRV